MMKIVGKTDDGFILTARKDEVAHLIGHYSEFDRAVCSLRSGDNIEINQMYHRLYDLKMQYKKLHTISNDLINFGKLLIEEVDPVTKPNIPTFDGDK